MPKKKRDQEQHLAGVSDKEQRMYEEILQSAKEDNRYKGREKEVAARTVMKHHKEGHHEKGE